VRRGARARPRRPPTPISHYIGWPGWAAPKSRRARYLTRALTG
jgi:hypothetical protein